MNQRIVLGVLDTSHRITTNLAEGFCRNIMEFWMIELRMQGLQIITDDDPETLLQKAAATDADWLVFSTLGTYFEKNHTFMVELRKYIAENPSFFIMGHILDRKENWYELHDQCFVMNLAEYRRLGRPEYGGGPRRGSFEMMTPERSDQNFHHDYTPHWVKHSTQFAMYRGLENGHNLLAEGFKAGLPMIAFPDRLRQSKYHFSPAVNESFARKYWWWENALRDNHRLFYAFNTESIPPLAPGYTMQPLKRLFTVASGLLFFKILKTFGFKPFCIVNFYDTSLHGLKIMQLICENWDGRNYPEFLRKHAPDNANLLNFQDAEKKWQAHLDEYGGEENWLNWFNQVIKGCQFRYRDVNIFSEQLENARWLEPEPDVPGDTLFYLSNVFHFRYTSGVRSLEERFQIQKTLLEWLAKHNPETFVYLCSAAGDLDPKASLGIFKARDYDADLSCVPRYWKSGSARLPKVLQPFFRRNENSFGQVRPRPAEFSAIQLANLNQTPKDQILRFAKWIESESHVPSLRLDLTIPYQEMWQEAVACREYFVKHREKFNPGWESVCLHGMSAQQTEDYNRYGLTDRSQANYRWTEIADRCPATITWLKEQWPMEVYHRVRFMLLKPGGFITPHNDMDNQRGLHATNVALNQPAGCQMVLEKYGVIPWRQGDVRRLDIGVNHCVYNGSDEDRYHMIIHGHVGNRHHEWAELIVRSYLKTDSHGN